MILDAVTRHIDSFPQTKIDYASLVDSDSLDETSTANERTRLALAVYIGGKVRLIDNALLAQQHI